MTMHLPTPNFLGITPTPSDHHRSMLIVCDKNHWMAQGRDVTKAENCWYIEIDGLTPEVLEKFKPDIVLSPLFGLGFDALVVANKLSKMAYPGPYRALTDKILNPDNIRKEVHASAPSIDFDLIVLQDCSHPLNATLDPA